IQPTAFGALGEPSAQTGDAVVGYDLVDGEARRLCVRELVVDGLLGSGDARVEDGCHRLPPMSAVLLSTQYASAGAKSTLADALGALFWMYAGACLSGRSWPSRRVDADQCLTWSERGRYRA